MAYTYFYSVHAADVKAEDGKPLPNAGNMMEFVGTTEEAHAKFFMHGFNLTSDILFRDDGKRFVIDEFDTEADELPNQLSILAGTQNNSLDGITFGKLIVSRFVQSHVGNSGQYGGRRRRRSTRRKRSSRKAF